MGEGGGGIASGFSLLYVYGAEASSACFCVVLVKVVVGICSRTSLPMCTITTPAALFLSLVQVINYPRKAKSITTDADALQAMLETHEHKAAGHLELFAEVIGGGGGSGRR